MRPTPLSLPRRLSLSWLMWLALLLPLAQSAAQWHGLSHSTTEAGAADLSRQIGGQTGGRTDGQAAGHALGCDLCLAGAALDSGSLLSTLAGLLLPTAQHAAPLAAAPGVWLPPLALAYLSRAPPAPR